MNKEATEAMFAAFFDELGKIEKQSMEKDSQGALGLLGRIGGAVTKQVAPLRTGVKQVGQALSKCM